MSSRTDHWLSRPLTAFIFLDVTDVDASRSLFEDGFGFAVAENRFHPPHHMHGIVKYDAGGTILALNKAGPGFRRQDSDRATIAVTSRREVSDLAAAHQNWVTQSRRARELRDGDNHHFTVLQSKRANAAVAQVHYQVRNLEATIAYFERSWGWHFKSAELGAAAVRMHDIVLSFVEAPDEAEPHRSGLFLTVFYAPDLSAAHDALAARGCRFLNAPQRSRIGMTVRFVDLDGHHFCIYEPSEESLCWESGPVLRRLIARSANGG